MLKLTAAVAVAVGQDGEVVPETAAFELVVDPPSAS